MRSTGDVVVVVVDLIFRSGAAQVNQFHDTHVPKINKHQLMYRISYLYIAQIEFRGYADRGTITFLHDHRSCQYGVGGVCRTCLPPVGRYVHYVHNTHTCAHVNSAQGCYTRVCYWFTGMMCQPNCARMHNARLLVKMQTARSAEHAHTLTHISMDVVRFHGSGVCSHTMGPIQIFIVLIMTTCMYYHNCINVGVRCYIHQQSEVYL